MKRRTASCQCAQAETQVALVNAHAVGLVSYESGKTVTSYRPENKLQVIAVVGPTVCQLGHEVPLAVLAEVGLRKTKPYVTTYQRVQGKVRVLFSARPKLFGLDVENFYKLVPALWQLIDQITEARVMAWKYGKHKPFRIYSSISKLLKKQKRVAIWERKFFVPPGVRYCFSVSDTLLCADSLALEMYHDRDVKRQLRGLVNYVDLCASRYSPSTVQSPRAQEVKYLVSARERFLQTDRRPQVRRPWFMSVHALRYLRGGRDNPTFHLAAGWLQWDESETLAEQLAKQALPGVKQRIPNKVRHLRMVRDQYLFFEYQLKTKSDKPF